MAGLFHSVYGTEFFRHRALDTRDELRALIGSEAELMVHEFCTTGRHKHPEIEAANLLEQDASPRSLRALLDTQISGPARVAIESRLVRDMDHGRKI